MTEPRKRYPFRAPPELAGSRGHYPVVIAGAGPVGLAAARDLGLRGIRTVILDDDDKVSVGSRAICWAKRTLEIFDRLGCAAPMMQKGVTWNTGKVFYGDDREPLFSFDLLPDRSQCFPAFINLQQYYVEAYLVDLVEATPLAELRWHPGCARSESRDDHVEIGVETPEGEYRLTADYLIAADGSRSAIRSMLGLEFEGEVFQDHFLIADIRMKAERPSERWFWFDPPFARGQSALLHKQPDDVWRLDFQLGWNIDRERRARSTSASRARVRRMLGEDARFELEWSSIYTFQCRRLDRFVHDRVIFAGDAAHLVSPFGARGANGGIQDIDNLCWKLACVLQGVAPRALLESYDAERVYAAKENIRHSTGSTEFITPKTPVSRAFRNAVLALAREHAFARAYVNSGRLSLPARLRGSPLTPPDCDLFGGTLEPGSPAIDAPVQVDGVSGWFLPQLVSGFTLVVFGPPSRDAVVPELPVPLRLLHLLPGDTTSAEPGCVVDLQGRIASHAQAAPGSCLLFRPDQHLACGFHSFESQRIRDAVLHCLGRGAPHATH